MDYDEDRQTAAQKVQFSELCDTLKQITNTVKTAKRFVFDRFLRRWRKEVITPRSVDGFQEMRTDDTFYPAMRFFVPSKDADRDFRVKEVKLNHLVSKATLAKPLDPLPSDKDLLCIKLASRAHGLFQVVNPKLSVHDVNEYLDRIKWPNPIDKQQDAMEKLCRQCTENELRWIFHTILGDCERALGMSAHAMMDWLHPGSDNLWKEGNSLLQICEQFAQEEVGPIGARGLALEGNLLCKPFRPMLLKRLNFNKDCLPKIIKFCHRPFYVEVKYDGEHLLVHRFNSTNYKYFTRNGIDYTHKMGPTNETLLSRRIHPFFSPTVRDCVLDCELLIWDRKMQEFVGKNKRASDGNVYDPKHLDDDFFQNHTQFDRSLAVFDILYLNGHCFLRENLTLKDRMDMLGRIFEREDRSVIFVSEKKTIDKADVFTDFYKHAMRTGEEGIVVKAMNSYYRAGSRAQQNGWFKIKPDYGVQSALDLAVVGVRFENAATMAHIKSFLVAARMPSRNTDPNEEEELRLKIVAGITSRLKALDYQKLRSALGDFEELLERRPPWLTTNPNWEEEEGIKRDKHVRFVPREKIPVVEVRASGLLNGRLQFPSIRAVRFDKLLEEIDTVNEVFTFDQRLRNRPMIDEPDPHEAFVLLNRKRRHQMHLKQSSQLITAPTANGKANGAVANIVRLSNALQGRKVCVLNANGGVSTQDLQKVLVALGATPIGNPTSDAAFLVAMDPKKMTCAAQIKANRLHIVHGQWLLRCQERKALVPWEDTDMLHKSPIAPFHLFTLPDEPEPEIAEEGQQETGTTAGIEQEADFGEPSTSAQNMPESEVSVMEESGMDESAAATDNFDMVRLAEEAEREEEKIGAELMDKLSAEDCEPAEEGNLFTDFVFFLHESVDRNRDGICRKIEAQNGQISNVLDRHVTHVVVGRMRSGQEKPLFDWNERQKQFNGQFVGAEWLERAIEEEDRYRLPDRIHEFIDH